VGHATAVAQFALPSPGVHVSYVDAVEEFQLEGRLTDLDPKLLRGSGAFREYLVAIHPREDPAIAGAQGRVSETTLWWVDAEVFLGELQIRHRLTDALRLVGGHIGYAVRPAVRRCGHATAMLAAALPRTALLGIDPALITCDITNDASRRVIEANGGALFDEDDSMLRFWVPTNTGAGPSLAVTADEQVLHALGDERSEKAGEA